METSYSKYQLWSPPALDLSLDTFSNDLIQEFDKSRSNIDLNEKKQATVSIVDEKEPESNTTANKHDLDEAIIKIAPVERNGLNQTNAVLPTSDPSSVTLPSSEGETSLHDEETASTANLFRKSSTFLKKKLSLNGGSNKKDEIGSIQSTNAEDITEIVSRQYPPKPLQYSPVVEPSPSNHTSISTASQLHFEQKNKDVENTSTIKSSIRNSISHNKRASAPISLASNSTTDQSPSSLPAVTRAITTTPAVVATSNTPSAPKRRSFFSLRFC